VLTLPWITIAFNSFSVATASIGTRLLRTRSSFNSFSVATGGRLTRVYIPPTLPLLSILSQLLRTISHCNRTTIESFQFFLSCYWGSPQRRRRKPKTFQFFLSCYLQRLSTRRRLSRLHFQFFLSCYLTVQAANNDLVLLHYTFNSFSVATAVSLNVCGDCWRSLSILSQLLHVLRRSQAPPRKAPQGFQFFLSCYGTWTSTLSQAGVTRLSILSQLLP